MGANGRSRATPRGRRDSLLPFNVRYRSYRGILLMSPVKPNSGVQATCVLQTSSLCSERVQRVPYSKTKYSGGCLYAFLTESQFPSHFGPTRSTSEAGNHQRANRKRAAHRFLAPGGTSSAAPGGVAQPPDRSGRAKAPSGPQHGGEQGRGSGTGHSIPPLRLRGKQMLGLATAATPFPLSATLTQTGAPRHVKRPFAGGIARSGQDYHPSPRRPPSASLPELSLPPGGNPPAQAPRRGAASHVPLPPSARGDITQRPAGRGRVLGAWFHRASWWQRDACAKRPGPALASSADKEPRGASAPSHARWPPSHASGRCEPSVPTAGQGSPREHVQSFKIGRCKQRSICVCLRSNAANRCAPTSDRIRRSSSLRNGTGVFLLPCCQRQNSNGPGRGWTPNPPPSAAPAGGLGPGRAGLRGPLASRAPAAAGGTSSSARALFPAPGASFAGAKLLLH